MATARVKVVALPSDFFSLQSEKFMILPIVGYGSPVLREVSKLIGPEYSNLQTLIANMFETMYNASGVGLAAPQINLPVRLFVIDVEPMDGIIEGDDSAKGNTKMVFINPEKVEETGTEWAFEEGCLSIPDIREDVLRKPVLVLKYFDERFEEKTEVFSGIKARVIQHEYDHLEGVLFTDKVSLLRKQLVKPRLLRMSAGNVTTSYPYRQYGMAKKKR